MYKLFLVSALTLFVVGCTSHQHDLVPDHWHSCDGQIFDTPIIYDEQLPNCMELMKQDILDELVQ